MKKILLLSSLFLICFISVKSEKSEIVQNILTKHVAHKVDEMQKLIQFSDAQAAQIKDSELSYLLKVQKAENCKCCNSTKKINKLKSKKDQDLQKILTREQYIKYDAIERDAIKNVPVRY